MRGRQLAWRRPGRGLGVGTAGRGRGLRVEFGGDRGRRRPAEGPRRRLRAERLAPARRLVRQDSNLREAFYLSQCDISDLISAGYSAGKRSTTAFNIIARNSSDIMDGMVT